jgi:hypothetical protein
MRAGGLIFFRRLVTEESGQVIPFMVFLSALFLGMAGLSMDLGRAYISYRELQASSDAAALAGGYALSLSGATVSSVKAYAASFSSASGGANVKPTLSGAVESSTLTCLTTVGVPCSASPTGDNVIIVQQTMTMPTLFLRALGIFGGNSLTSATIATKATAVMRGSANAQYNVAVVLDSTGSMGQADTDGNCTKNTTKEVCALSGIQTLLSGLTPCGSGSTSTTCASPFDSVALFTFPNVKASTATNATTCSGSNPTGTPYSVPAIWSAPTASAPNYEITSGFLDNYSSTNAYNGSIATSSPIGIATGADTGKNCNGLTTPISGQGTYLAGAIYAAQSALAAAQSANKGSENAMIILTDGDANATNTFTDATGKTLTASQLNSNGTYPSMIDQCQQAISAAQYAASNGTTVYVVAYQSPTSGCSTDAAAYRDPCSNLQAMALKAGSTTPYPANFYSDATTANKGACTSTANPNLTLNQVFQSVAVSFTVARLIPN